MSLVARLWHRIPVVMQAVLTGLVVLTVGQIPWMILSYAFLRSPHSPPWELPVMALYLVVYWRYLNGWGWPKSTSALRRESLRARGLSPDVWAGAMAAGMLAVTIVFALQSAYSQLAPLPAAKNPQLSIYPWFTLLPTLIMSGAVAGIVEEASFRGYMQAGIERRHGPVIAIAVTSVVFAAIHFTHGMAHTLPRVPYYMAISAIYGVLTYKTGSILPALVIHAVGDVIEFLMIWGASS